MTTKPLPIDSKTIRQLAETYPTPFHLYDEKSIRANARRLNAAFAWCEGFKEYFAVKATPNPHLIKILKEEGFGVDCSSIAELVLSERIGLTGDEIMFTSNNTPANEFAKAKELGAILNLDDFTHIEFLDKYVGMPKTICFRYNPGPLREGNVIIGSPEEAKYGFTRSQLLEAYGICKSRGVERFGLHTMVASNELNHEFFVETARMLFELAVEIKQLHGIQLDFVNLGGGIGIPYRPEDQAIDLEKLGADIKAEYDRLQVAPLNVLMENGRMVTGPYGCLVTKAIHKKDIYKNYIGVDACMANLMRPGMYEAYHHISVLGKESATHDRTYDVVGSLCENNDKFAVDRQLPQIDIDDLVVIHDTGAHGHSMGFQYNGKLRSAELLLKEDGSAQEIRRAETLDDYFATLEFPTV
ncbi:MAG: diaminopimelate decarboxylase [Planctomycetaceae bacterium]|nr:diaminopimelate decarboxylase [Planctomycetaceae bacterium]